jgi:DNA-binding transcriptional regulator YdaS (Cro superfamily)
MDELNKAIDLAGGVGAFARLLGMGQSVVSNWRARGAVAADACPAIERATDGGLTCEVLRPDIAWHRITDPVWPHPNGRPLIDVTAKVPA